MTPFPSTSYCLVLLQLGSLLFLPTLFFTSEQNAESPLVGMGPVGLTVAAAPAALVGVRALVGALVGAGVLVETICPGGLAAEVVKVKGTQLSVHAWPVESHLFFPMVIR